jgi:hypothetical protein
MARRQDEMHATQTPATGHGRRLLDFQLEFYIFLRYPFYCIQLKF